MVRRYESPCGVLLLGSLDDKLCMCDWLVEKHHTRVCSRLKESLEAAIETGTTEVIEHAAGQLDDFFAGQRKRFGIPLLFAGTDFQKAVWKALLDIPYGQTISYGTLAHRIGRPKATRAVANANGANPISIFVPCHRVIGSDGSLTGYGGGLDTKRALLELEGMPIFYEAHRPLEGKMH